MNWIISSVGNTNSKFEFLNCWLEYNSCIVKCDEQGVYIFVVIVLQDLHSLSLTRGEVVYE